MNFDGVLTQIFQPYFYYSIIFLVLSFVCIKVLAQYSNFMSQRTKSLLYLVPLAVPLIVMLVFVPSAVIQPNGPVIKTAAGTLNTGGTFNGFPVGSQFPPMPPPGFFILTRAPPMPTILSFTGIICIVGLAAGAFFALTMIAADDRIARKVLHVIMLSPGEHPWLQAKVAELSKKLSISTPNVGVVEDLRPNAFTIGYGKKSTIVFSAGIFNLLSEEEIAAVASHELAHVKNHDFFYKICSSALTLVSFFNPLSFIVSSTSQREREMFADEQAVAVLEKPAALGNALAKICKAIESLPKENPLFSFSSNLLVTSSVLHRLGILSTHPRLDKRLRNISAPNSHVRLSRRSIGLAVFLSLLLVCSSVTVSFAMVDLQTGFTSSQQAQPPHFGTTGYGVGENGGMLPSNPVVAYFGGGQMADSPVVSMPAPNHGPVILMVNNGSAPDGAVIVVNAPVFLPHGNLTFVP